MVKVMAVYDEDPLYAGRLAEYVNQKETFPFQAMAFSDLEKLKEYGQTHDIEILLAGENVREKAKEVKAGLKMILCDGEFVSKGEAKEEASVYKYQSGDCILQEVMACYCIAPPQPGLALMGKSGLVMGVYSPVGRCGKTSFALALAHMLGKSQAVLFISLEEYSGFSKLVFRRLDILQELLDDKEVTEIMINGAGKIFIEKKGKMLLWNRRFEKTEQLEDIIQQIVGKVNRIVNVSSPIADARLEDGSRVHIVLPPVALDGPVVTIRKFPEPVTIEKLIRFQAITEEAAAFLEKLVEARYNIFVSGGTNSGKTTFLNALSSFIPEQERVITIEDSAELQIRHVPNLVRMETRNANTEGEGEITISQLIKASLRMNPSRIIVGEVRGGEALDMLQAIICTI